MELCSSYAVRGNRSEQKIELQRSYRKCLFVYQYWMHPVCGFMSQTANLLEMIAHLAVDEAKSLRFRN